MCKDEEPRPEYVTVEGQKVKGQRYPSLVAKLPTLRIRNQITMYLSSFEIRFLFLLFHYNRDPSPNMLLTILSGHTIP